MGTIGGRLVQQITPELILGLVSALASGGILGKLLDSWLTRRNRAATADGAEAVAAAQEVDAVSKLRQQARDMSTDIIQLQRDLLEANRRENEHALLMDDMRREIEDLKSLVIQLQNKVSLLSQGLPPIDYHAVRVLLPQNVDLQMAQQVVSIVHPLRHTITLSVDDACIGRLKSILVMGVGFSGIQWARITEYAGKNYPQAELHLHETLDDLREYVESEIQRKVDEEGWTP